MVNYCSILYVRKLRLAEMRNVTSTVQPAGLNSHREPLARSALATPVSLPQDTCTGGLFVPGVLCPRFCTCLAPPDLHASTDSSPRSLLWPFARPNHPVKMLFLSGLPFPPRDLSKVPCDKRAAFAGCPPCVHVTGSRWLQIR